ncbi:MAG: CapA family protein [Ruminiclostridium sp.]|nr:CapA family protein [Ruminiclostridium sp.]
MNFKQLCEGQPRFPIETGTAENTVSLTWDKVPYADGYRVFSSPHGKNRFVGQLNTNVTRAVFKNCKNGVVVDYKIKAFRIADGPDNYFAESQIVSLCPMKTPHNLVAGKGGDNAIILYWMDDSDSDGYKVYIDKDCNDKYTFLQYSGATDCKVDTTGLSGKVRFRVRSFKIINHTEKISNASEYVELELKQTTDVESKTTERTIKRFADGVTGVTSNRYAVKQGVLRNENHKCLIMLGGDIATSAATQHDALIRGFGFDYTMSSLGEVFRSSDFSVAALDTDVNDEKDYTYENEKVNNCPSVFLDTLCQAGLDSVALSGKLARKTPKALSDYPLSVFSSGASELEGERFRIVDINNIKVGFLSTTIDYDIASAISTIKSQGAEFIVVYCNWKERHTPVVKESWRKYSAKLAEYGADFIVGCGLGTLCEYDVITTKDGRNVSVAYSLGSVTPGKAVIRFEDIGALLCLRLVRDRKTGKVKNEQTGYIPYAMTKGASMRHALVLAEANRQTFGNSDYTRYVNQVKSALGEKIGYARYQKANKDITFALNGSPLISELFKDNEEVITDRSHLFISQFALCGKKIEVEEGMYRDSVTPLYWNLTKDFEEYLKENKKDALVLDFYYAVTTPHYELDGVLYSGGRAFRESRFYEENASRLKRVDIRENDLWKPLLEKYIEAIKSVYDNRRIILVKVTDPKLYYRNGRFIKTDDTSLDSKFLFDVECYFIRMVNPIVIDVSGYYPGYINKRGVSSAVNRDSRFTQNISEAAINIARDDYLAQSFSMQKNSKLWLSMVEERFDAIKKSDCDDFFFSSNVAADIIISKLNSDFIGANFDDLQNMKKNAPLNLSELISTYDFGENNTLRRVCSAIHSLLAGKLDNKGNEDIIRLDLYAKNLLAQTLSSYFDKEGIIPECSLDTRNLDFYLKCAQLIISGKNKSAVSMLVSEYYNKNRPVTVDMLGGSNLKDIIGECTIATGGAFIADCSVLTAFCEPVKVDYSYVDPHTLFYKELAKRRFDKISTPSDWILIDFNEIIRPIYIHENTYFVSTPKCEMTRIFKAFLSEDKQILPYEKKSISDDYVKECVKKLADFLTEKYGENIILSTITLNENYLDNSDAVCPFDGEGVEKKNRLIKVAEKEFIKLTDCYVINYSDKFISQQTGIKNRAFTATYETEFYTHCARAVDSIIKGESQKKLYDNVDILSYIERAHRILKANPEMPYDLQKQLFGDMTPLVTV